MKFKDLVPRKDYGKHKLARHNNNPFSLLQRDMDRLFDDLWRTSQRGFGFGQTPWGGGFSGTIVPSIDVSESETEFKISAELPGMDEKDVELSLHGDFLTIKGEKKLEKEEKEKDYYRMERSYGSFSRTIPIPEGTDREKIDASFSKGVLTVTLPKLAEAVRESKRIEIKKH